MIYLFACHETFKFYKHTDFKMGPHIRHLSVLPDIFNCLTTLLTVSAMTKKMCLKSILNTCWVNIVQIRLKYYLKSTGIKF